MHICYLIELTGNYYFQCFFDCYELTKKKGGINIPPSIK